jgi:hypothetical protein
MARQATRFEMTEFDKWQKETETAYDYLRPDDNTDDTVELMRAVIRLFDLGAIRWDCNIRRRKWSEILNNVLGNGCIVEEEGKSVEIWFGHYGRSRKGSILLINGKIEEPFCVDVKSVSDNSVIVSANAHVFTFRKAPEEDMEVKVNKLRLVKKLAKSCEVFKPKTDGIKAIKEIIEANPFVEYYFRCEDLTSEVITTHEITVVKDDTIAVKITSYCDGKYRILWLFENIVSIEIRLDRAIIKVNEGTYSLARLMLDESSEISESSENSEN